MSTRQAEAKLAAENPEAFRVEKVRESIDGEGLRVTLTLSKAQKEKLEQVRAMLSHVDPHFKISDLFERLLDLYIDRHDPLKKAERASLRQARANVRREGEVGREGSPEAQWGRAVGREENPEARPERAVERGENPEVRPERTQVSLPQRLNGASCSESTGVPKAIEHAVRLRDRNRCVWPREDGTLCGSRWQVEIDHVIPRALGGPDTPANLRCLCRKHNVVAAHGVFGREKIEAHSA